MYSYSFERMDGTMDIKAPGCGIGKGREKDLKLERTLQNLKIVQSFSTTCRTHATVS